MHSYDDISLSIVNDLNTKILNQSFVKLVDNDQQILPEHNYIPQIWENKWFNDNSIGGYFRGDAVWRNIVSLDKFVESYYKLIHKYAKENRILNGYLSSVDEYENEIHKYKNIISGYGEYVPSCDIDGNIIPNSNYWAQKLPMLFDCGDLSADANVEIFISLIDNNKEYLSNSNAWANIILSNENAISTYISTEISILMDKHLKDYHLNGISTEQQFSDIILKSDFSNFNISALYNAYQITNHDDYINDQGFDYVMSFKKDNSTKTIINGITYDIYRWCRLWHSGHLEHGGIIEIPKGGSEHDLSNYVLSIDFSWVNSNELIYDYNQTSSFYENTSNNLYFANGIYINNYGISNDTNDLTYNDRYTVSITPVQFNGDDINGSLLDSTKLTSIKYPESANADLNKTFVNFEIHQITNTGFCITRSRTDDINSNDSIRYVQYYVSGYRTQTKIN